MIVLLFRERTDAGYINSVRIYIVTYMGIIPEAGAITALLLLGGKFYLITLFVYFLDKETLVNLVKHTTASDSSQLERGFR